MQDSQTEGNHVEVNENQVIISEKPSSKKVLWISLGVSTLVIVLILCITLPLMLMKKEDKPLESIEEEDPLIIEVKREINEMSRYQQVSHSNIAIVFDGQEGVNKQAIYSDLLFNIYDVKNGTKNGTNLYYAYAIMNNMTMVTNGKSAYLGGLDLYEEWGNKNPNNPDEEVPEDGKEEEGDDDEVEDNTTLFPNISITNCTFDFAEDCTTSILSIPIVKFSFYENGTIDEIYKPHVIEASMWSTILEAIKQFTPALSKSLYDNKLRRLSETKSSQRSFQKEGTNAKLQETSINQGGIDGIEIDSSSLKFDVDTIVDETQGKITSVSSSGESKLITSDNVLDDISVSPDSPLSDIDKSNGTNTMTSGFESLSTKIDTTMNLIYSKQEPESTDLVKKIANTVTFTLYSKNDIKESKKIRNLLSFPYKEYTGDLTKIPNKLDALRLLKMDNFLRPIELSYCIFKSNQLGIKSSLNILLSIDMLNDKIQGKAILTVAYHQLEVFNYDSKANVKDLLVKADGIVTEFAKMINNVEKEALSIYDNIWSENLRRNATAIKLKLNRAYKLKERYLFFDNLNGIMSNIIEDRFEDFVTKISEALNQLADILDTTLIEGQSIATKLIEVLSKNVEDFYAAELIKLNEYDTKVIGNIQELVYKLNELPNESVLDLDISIEAKEAVSKTIPTYEKHLASMHEGIITRVNNVIAEGIVSYNSKVGKIIDDISLTLSSNHFLQDEYYAEMLKEAKTAMQKIKKAITDQIETLYNTIRITKENIGINPITKDKDKNLQSDLESLISNLKSKQTQLINKLEQFTMNQSINHLIKNLNSIQAIENSVKNTNIEAFKTYFNTSLIWNNLPDEIITELNKVINIDLSKEEKNLQSLILDIKFNSSASYNDLNEYINTELDPIKDDLRNLFALNLLTPILNDIMNVVSKSWVTATEVFEKNFKLANDYVIDVNNSYYVFNDQDEGNIKYYTSQFQSNYEKGREFLRKFKQSAKAKVNVIGVFNDIKKNWNDKLQQLKNNPSNEFAQQLIDFPFIKAFFDDLNYVSQSFDDFFKPFEDNINQSIESELKTFESYADKLILDYEASNSEFLLGSTQIQKNCDIFRDKAQEYFQCHMVKTTTNLLKLNDKFELADFSSDIKLDYDKLINDQMNYINTVISSLDKIKDKQQSFYASLEDNKQLKDIISSWKDTALDFETQYLNSNLKNRMKTKIGDIINNESQKFLAFSKQHINENTKAFYEQFIAGIDSFEYKPKEISYRLDQIYTFAQQNLINLDTDINVFLMKSFDHSMSYYYHLMENEFTSFLNAFNDHFVLDINPIFKDTLQAKITTLIGDIKQQYQANLQSVLMNDNPKDYWNLNWLKTEFDTVILPEFKSTIDQIKAKIESLSKPDDNYSMQSTKIEQSITNTFKGSSTIISTAEVTLDTCLMDINKETIKKLFEQHSSMSFDFLKSNLKGFNDRLLLIESKIIKAYEHQFSKDIIQYFSQDKVESTFNEYLKTVFTFPFDTIALITDKVESFKTNIYATFNKEISSIQQQPGTTKYLKRSFFVDLFNKHELQIYNTVNQFLIDYMNSIYGEIKTLTASKLNEKQPLYLSNIDLASTGVLAGPITLFTNEWSALDSIVSSIAQSKNKISVWFNYIDELIKENYKYANKVAQEISNEVKHQLRIVLDLALEDWKIHFQPTEEDPSIDTSIVFNESIKTDFSIFSLQIEATITEQQIKNIIQQQLNTVPLESVIFGDDNQFQAKINMMISKMKDQMDSRNTIIKTNVLYYLNYQLKFQSESVSNLLFGKDAYYTQLKDKCIDPYLKLVLGSTNSKINDMSDYVLSLLDNANSIKASLVSNLPTIVNEFDTKMKTTVVKTLNDKVANAISSYMAIGQEQMPLYFETTFTSVIKNNNFNLVSIIQDNIRNFDMKTIQTAFTQFFTEETNKAQSLFVTPLRLKITNGINAVLENLSIKINEIITIFESKEKEENTDTDEIFATMRTIISNHVTLINKPFTDYLLTIDSKVQTMFNTLFDRYADKLLPMTTIFSDIKTQIENEVTKMVNNQGINNNNFQKDYDEVKDYVIWYQKNITATIDSITTILTNKVTSFEQDVYNKFFGLRRNTELNIRETSEVYTISDINTALTSLKNTMNNIKALIASTSNYSTIKSSFENYQADIASGLNSIKEPINRVINIFNTILDSSFITQFEATMDKSIADMTRIVETNQNELIPVINTALSAFKDYQYQAINTLNANFQVLIDPQLNKLFKKVLSLLQTIDNKQDYISTDTPNLEFSVNIMGKPIVFTFKFTHHYSYGFNIVSKDSGIYMSAYIEDKTEIQSKNAVSIGGVEYGGRVSGIIGQGKTSIGPYYKFNDFKVYLLSNADMTASTVKVYEYTITPRWYSVKHCKRKWYGKKKCWWEQIWWNDKQENTREIPEGENKKSSWNKLY